MYQYKRFEVKKCSQSDFGNSTKQKKFFKDWQGDYSLICPDFFPGQGLQMQGNTASMLSKNFMFKIKKCDDKLNKKMKRLPCKSDDEINEFISNI